MPKWDVWKHVPILNATEAVSLTLNIEPHTVYEWSKGKWVYNIGKKSGMCTSIAGFADRLFLFKKCFGVDGKISLIQLANWSQSVGWNIPIELAAVAPVEPKEILKTMSAEAIRKALAGIVVGNDDIDELQSELIKLDVKFIVCNDLETVQIPDGTVNGKRVPILNLYSVVSELCNEPRGAKLATLVRGSGASGSGATGSTSRSESLISDYNSRDSNSQPNEITNNKLVSQQEILSGKMPNTAIGKLAVKAAIQNTIGGINKRKVMSAFQGLKWDYDYWGKNLASPSNRLKDCRVEKGSKKQSALWNPVDIGLYLLGEGIQLKKIDAIFVDLKDWADEWREKTELERD